MPFLVPGYGTQGGSASDVAPAFDDSGLGALVNNSRGITFAYRKPSAVARFGDDWRGAIAQAVRDMVDDLAANSNAARLKPKGPERSEGADRKDRPLPSAGARRDPGARSRHSWSGAGMSNLRSVGFIVPRGESRGGRVPGGPGDLWRETT